MNEAKSWIDRAKSNLVFAKKISKEDLVTFGGDIFFEDPCYELQQAVEKSLKALLLYNEVEFPRTHDIDQLIKLLKLNSVEVPDKILEASIMTQYAVRTRYPDDSRRITQEEYCEALNIAENVYEWVKSIINV